MSNLDDRLLSLNPGRRLDLYTMDLTPNGGGILRFCPYREDFTPAYVSRLEDDNPTAQQQRVVYDLSDKGVQAGDRLLFECFMRHITGDSYPSVGFAGTTSYQNSPNAMFDFDLNGLRTNTYQSGAMGNTLTATISPASEWVYCAGAFTYDAPTNNLYMLVEPAAGVNSAWGSSGGTNGSGTVDIFGLRVYKLVGGMRIPLAWGKDFRDVHAWTSHPDDGLQHREVPNNTECVKVPVWQGNAYTPIPIRAEGFEVSGVGQFPKPTMSMSNLTGAGSLLLQTYGDIRGCEVTRTRVFADNLDNGIDPDPASFMQPELFYINRKTRETGVEVQIELASRLDQQGAKLPARQVLRDVCPWSYRQWDATAGAFVYEDEEIGCPYTGTAYFDINGNAVANPEEDVCSRKFGTGCRARYGKSETLPLGSFPMVGRQGS